MYTISRDCPEDKNLVGLSVKEGTGSIQVNAGSNEKANNQCNPCAKELHINRKIVNFLSQLAGPMA